MGQHLSQINSQIIDQIQVDRITLDSTAIISNCSQEDVDLFLPIKILSDTTNYERPWIKQIQNSLFLLTNVSKLEMNSPQIENVFTSISSDYVQMIQEIKDIFEKSEQFKICLINKLEEEKKSIELDTQPSLFASQFFTLFQSAEKNVSTIIHHFFESEKNNIDQSTLPNNQMTEKQVEKILLNFSATTGMFKDILPLLNQLIFDTVNLYEVRKVFNELNDRFKSIREEWQQQYINELGCQLESNATSTQTEISSNTMKYLSSMGVFPIPHRQRSRTKRFSGQFISMFIFAHIDFDNTISSNKQFESSLMDSSMSFEFHPHTFKQLFHTIQQLTDLKIENLNENLLHILIISLRLFTTHLKFFSIITTNLHRDLLETNESLQIPSSVSNKQIELNVFVTDKELQTWFDTLLILACHANETTEQIQICREASKAFIYILDKKETSFTKKLSFMYQHVIEDKYNIFVEQLLIELSTNAALFSWIEVLCDSNDRKYEQTTALTILYGIIDIYLNSTNNMKTQRIEHLLQNFQKLVFVRLGSKLGSSTVSLVINYITYILNNSNKKRTIHNDILLGLSLMTDTDKHFTFPTIQPIFTTILPLLTDMILQNKLSEELITNNLHYNSWLLGTMSHILMIGPPQDSLELNYIDQLQSPLFIGGCENIINENNEYLLNLFESNIAVSSQFKINDYKEQESLSDKELLMSIYNNTDQGAELISKMKMYIKDKQHLLQKSIEQQANNACAAIFSVYIKYYRRINLVKSELSRMNTNQKPHYKLLSIFEYANRIQTLFATTKGQGGDCNELYQQIKNKTLFLLLSIKESQLIPRIENVSNEQISQQQGSKFKRQYSRRKIEKRTFRLIRNLFQACRQFKKLVLAKKKPIEQKQNNESILHRAIDNYIYGDFLNNKTTSETNELIQCMSRQYERAIIRLITYRFINKFIQNVLNIENKNVVDIILTIYLPYLRNIKIEWNYLENISATNIQLKEEIGNIYYSIIQTILSYLFKLTNNEQILSIRNLFNLLNLSYKSHDIYYLHQYRFLQILFNPFVSFVENPIG